MKKWKSFTALNRVKQQVESQAGTVSKILDGILATPAGEEKNLQKLGEPLDNFSRVPGALEILGFQHLALLAREITLSLNEIINTELEFVDRELAARLELSYVSVTDLPALLEDSLKNGTDDFEKVFQLLNRLRKYRDCAVIFDSNVLFEKQQVNFSKQFEQRPEKMCGLISKQSDYFSKCCKLLSQDSTNEKALDVISKVSLNVAVMLRDYKIGTMWGMVSGLTDLLDRQGSDSKDIIGLISRLSQPLQKIAKGDLASLNENIDESMLEAFLNCIAANNNDSKAVRVIRHWYSLDAASARQLRLNYRNLQVVYSNKEALSKSLGCVVEDISEVMEDINRVSQNESIAQVNLDAINQRVVQLRNVLEFVGIKFLVENMDQVLSNNESKSPEQALSSIAGILFSISKELNNKLENMEREVFGSEKNMSDASTLSSAKLHILQNAIKALETVTSLIDSYFENELQGNEPELIINALDELSGVFSVIQLKDQVEQLQIARNFMALLSKNHNDDLLKENFQILSQLAVNWLWYLEQLSIGGENDSQNYLDKGYILSGKLLAYLDSIPALDVTSATEAVIDNIEAVEKTSNILNIKNPDGQSIQQAEHEAEQKIIDDAIGIILPENALPVLSSTTEDNEIFEVDDELRMIFAEEFDEVLGMLVEAQEDLARDFNQPELLKDCCRYFHTIKGSGNMVGATDIGTLGLAMEKLYDHVHVHQGSMNRKILDHTSKIIAFLPSLKSAFVNPADDTVSTDLIDDFCQKSSNLITGDTDIDQQASQEILSEKTAISSQDDMENVHELATVREIHHVKDVLDVQSEQAEQDIQEVSELEEVQEVQEVQELEEIEEVQAVDQVHETHEVSDPQDELLIESDPLNVSDADDSYQHILEPPVNVVENLAGENMASGFSNELTDLNNTIETLLANEKSPPVTSDLIIPMHTIYGNARVHELENFSRAVQLVEKYLQKNPQRFINTEMSVVFQQFCAITQRQIEFVTQSQVISEYHGLDDDIKALELTLSQLGNTEPNEENAVLSMGEANRAGSASEAEDTEQLTPNVPEGFLVEARDLLARIDQDFQSMISEESPGAAVRIHQSLEFLESAAEAAELDSIKEMAGSMDSLYEDIIDSNNTDTTWQQEPLLKGYQYLEESINRLENGEALDDCEDLLKLLAYKQPESDLLVEKKLHKELADVQEADVVSEMDSNTDLHDSAQTEVLTDYDRDSEPEEFDEELLAVFLDEAEELLQELDNLYLKWQEKQDKKGIENVVDEFLRILHTLKGSAALMLEKDISSAAHDYETFIIDARDKNGTFDDDFFASCDIRLHELHDIYSLYSKDEDGRIHRAQSCAGDAIDTMGFETAGQGAAHTSSEPDTHVDNQQTTLDAEISEQEVSAINDLGVEVSDAEYQDAPDQMQTGDVEEGEFEQQDSNTSSKLVEVLNGANEAGEQQAASNEAFDSDTEAEFITESTRNETLTPDADIDSVPDTQSADIEPEELQIVVDEQVRVSSQLLKSLLNDADEINFSRNRIEKDMDDINTYLVDMDETIARLKSYVERVDKNAKKSYISAIEESRVSGGIAEEFDALEMDRYTDMQEMSLSLTEDYDDLEEIRSNLSGRLKDIDNVLQGQQRYAHSLQGGLISSQMVSFSSVVPRLRRLVRQVSRKLNKDVTFEVDSRQDNLDKNALQTIITPLEHLLRNALDHGIETIEQRVQSGKPAQATLSVTVSRAGTGIRIQVSDDGRGIDVDKVKQQALNKGLIAAGDTPDTEAIHQLIFQPGLSTSAEVSDISGRGVGMDVVRSELKQIGASVDVSSESGAGTTFVINLPTTSSLDRALIFGVQDSRYVVQMNTLDGVLVKKLADIHQKQQQGEVPVFEYSGKQYEYQYLGQLIDQDAQPRLDSIDSSIVLLLVTGKDKNFALHIDAIIESRDLVVKSLGKQLAAMQGIAGGVIMPDGHVAVVLDLVSLVSCKIGESGSLMNAAMLLSGNKDNKQGIKTIMVVDDSITVRKVTTAILKRNGMNVITAKNGLEAIELLEEQVPDMILLDIEMPKMDGFEVASYIRKQDAPIRNVPIIMITSRIGDKHRTRADEIGVNEYLCKPFQEDNLLGFIDNY